MLDPDTGEVSGALTPLEQAEAHIRLLENDLHIQISDNIILKRHLATLKTQLSRQLSEGDEGKIARAISRYYVLRMKRRKGWVFGPKRQKAVVDRLKEGYTGMFIARAIDGAAVGAYTNPTSGLTYDDLELICRDEVKLERFHAIAEAHEAESLVNAEWEVLLKGGRLPEDDDDPPMPAPPDDPKKPVNSGDSHEQLAIPDHPSADPCSVRDA